MLKKRIIIISSITLLVLLTINFFHGHVDGVKRERAWYVNELGFEFSGRVDTVIRRGNILIKDIDGILDFDKETRLNEKLRYNGVLALFLYRPNNKIELMIDSAERYSHGDSIYIHCKNNIIRIYRDDRLITEKVLLKSIRGRPF